MFILTDGENIAKSIHFTSITNMPAKSMEQKTSTDKDEKVTTKVAPDGSGRVQYKAGRGLKALQADETGEMTREVSDVSVAVLTPTDLERRTDYALDGPVWVTPWVTKTGRVGYSIVCERLKKIEDEPVDAKKGANAFRPVQADN